MQDIMTTSYNCSVTNEHRHEKLADIRLANNIENVSKSLKPNSFYAIADTVTEFIGNSRFDFGWS